MIVISNRNEIRNKVNMLIAKSKSIGFVPTMGALHQGHLTLVEQAKHENDYVVVSIFVNPTQFNNKEDLNKYPRDTDADLEKLDSVGCDFVFLPAVDEMYPRDETLRKYDFGSLTHVMEGKNRPGHFDGVATIVHKLFEAIPATRAYFGKKDYQQLLVIKSLVKQLRLNIEIRPCNIVREADGLAMSSRNQRLTKEQRKVAPVIYQTLQKAVKMASNTSPDEIKAFVMSEINKVTEMKLEYFEMANADSFQPIIHFEKNKNIMGFIVVNLGAIRLIDNIQFF
ncbi:MAG: pantoate--beta-alanine ligase [Bacteroidetes bacterium]|nr:MAG: pantoate--beta-alanine ligase [Bacteroidota bacterium]